MRLFYPAGRLLPRRASPTRLSNVVQGARQARALPWTRRIGGALRTPGQVPRPHLMLRGLFLFSGRSKLGLSGFAVSRNDP